MPVHLEFIADDLGALAALLAPLSSDDVTLEFTQQGDVYISIDMRGQTPEEAEPTPGDVIRQVADESPSSSSWAAELAATTAATTAADVDEPEPDAERVEESEPEVDPGDELSLGGYAAGTCGYSIIRLLNNEPERVFSIDDVVKGCPTFAAGTVKVTLSPLHLKNLIRRVQPGRYQAI